MGDENVFPEESEDRKFGELMGGIKLEVKTVLKRMENGDVVVYFSILEFHHLLCLKNNLVHFKAHLDNADS